MIDLSSVTELAPLADVVRDVVRAAARAEAEVFVAGAFGRDLWLRFAYGIETGRATADLDFAVLCESWETFARLAEALLESGFRSPEPKRLHRFVHANGTPIDIVPFGGVERPDRTIAWPPDESHEMSLVGFQETHHSAVRFLLPGGDSVLVASLAALTVLKLIAWRERGVLEPGKDAKDLHVILRNYVDAGTQDRLFSEIPGLTDRQEIDLELAGAELLGRDVTRVVPAELRTTLIRILEQESDSGGDLRLAGEMARYDVERARALLGACLAGLRAVDDSGETRE